MFYLANSLPPPATRAVPQAFTSYEEAEQEQWYCIAEQEDQLTNGLTVVKFEGFFYVVHGKEIFKGFHDYEGGDLA